MAHGHAEAVAVGLSVSAFNVLSGLSALLALPGQLSDLAVIPNEISVLSGLTASMVAWLFMGMGYMLGIFSVLAYQKVVGDDE